MNIGEESNRNIQHRIHRIAQPRLSNRYAQEMLDQANKSKKAISQQQVQSWPG
jgi:hypothetical protein